LQSRGESRRPLLTLTCASSDQAAPRAPPSRRPVVVARGALGRWTEKCAPRRHGAAAGRTIPRPRFEGLSPGYGALPSSPRPPRGRLAGRTLAGRTLAGRTLAGRTLAGRTLAGRTPGRSDSRSAPDARAPAGLSMTGGRRCTAHEQTAPAGAWGHRRVRDLLTRPLPAYERPRPVHIPTCRDRRGSCPTRRQNRAGEPVRRRRLHPPTADHAAPAVPAAGRPASDPCPVGESVTRAAGQSSRECAPRRMGSHGALLRLGEPEHSHRP
jgi:hypothetical protein